MNPPVHSNIHPVDQPAAQATKVGAVYVHGEQHRFVPVRLHLTPRPNKLQNARRELPNALHDQLHNDAGAIDHTPVPTNLAVTVHKQHSLLRINGVRHRLVQQRQQRVAFVVCGYIANTTLPAPEEKA